MNMKSIVKNAFSNVFDIDVLKTRLTKSKYQNKVTNGWIYFENKKIQIDIKEKDIDQYIISFYIGKDNKELLEYEKIKKVLDENSFIANYQKIIEDEKSFYFYEYKPTIRITSYCFSMIFSKNKWTKKLTLDLFAYENYRDVPLLFFKINDDEIEYKKDFINNFHRTRICSRILESDEGKKLIKERVNNNSVNSLLDYIYQNYVYVIKYYQIKKTENFNDMKDILSMSHKEIKNMIDSSLTLNEMVNI